MGAGSLPVQCADLLQLLPVHAAVVGCPVTAAQYQRCVGKGGYVAVGGSGDVLVLLANPAAEGLVKQGQPFLLPENGAQARSKLLPRQMVGNVADDGKLGVAKKPALPGVVQQNGGRVTQAAG